MRRGEAWLLAAAVTARGLVAAWRFAGSPERFVNREEAHNATAAWLFSQGAFLGDMATVQYRSFCGGCSVVSLAGAPLLGLSENLWTWKLLAIVWSAAIQVTGFLALRATTNAAAGWVWLLLCCAPPIGALDLSLMLWGNHQESGLFVLLALLAYARRRPFLMGLALGFGVYFARTSAYAAVVLLPLGLLAGRRSAVATFAGFLLGAAPLFVPAAGGDAGWYRFGEALVPTLDRIGDRASTILLPGGFASRAWLPLRQPLLFGALWLGLAAVCSGALLVWRRSRVLVGLALSWALAFTFTSFPIFLVKPSVPVNNIRYHSPWMLLLTLLLAAGLGEAWHRGWHRTATAAIAVVVLGNLGALSEVLVRPLARSAEVTAVDIAGFVTTVAARFDDPEALPTGLSHPLAEGLMARLRGLARSRARLPLPTGLSADELAGYGEGLVEPCSTAEVVVGLWEALPQEQRLPVSRGVGLTLSFCPRSMSEEYSLMLRLAMEAECAPCSLAGRRLLDNCTDPATSTLKHVNSCLGLWLGLRADIYQSELAYGLGRAWEDPGRTPDDRTRLLRTFAERPDLADQVSAGMRDASAGSRQPALAREGMAAGAGPSR